MGSGSRTMFSCLLEFVYRYVSPFLDEPSKKDGLPAAKKGVEDSYPGTYIAQLKQRVPQRTRMRPPKRIAPLAKELNQCNGGCFLVLRQPRKESPQGMRAGSCLEVGNLPGLRWRHSF